MSTDLSQVYTLWTHVCIGRSNYTGGYALYFHMTALYRDKTDVWYIFSDPRVPICHAIDVPPLSKSNILYASEYWGKSWYFHPELWWSCAVIFNVTFFSLCAGICIAAKCTMKLMRYNLQLLLQHKVLFFYFILLVNRAGKQRKAAYLQYRYMYCV